MSPPVETLVAPATWTNHLLTVGLLPEQVRDQYGFTWTERQARALSVVLGALRIARARPSGPLGAVTRGERGLGSWVARSEWLSSWGY
jgi:hypothetical protein